MYYNTSSLLNQCSIGNVATFAVGEEETSMITTTATERLSVSYYNTRL